MTRVLRSTTRALERMPYETMEVSKMAVPRSVQRFNIETDDRYDDTMGNLIAREAPSTNAIFSDAVGKPMFTYKNTKSRSRTVGNRTYYNDTMLFWEEVNKIMEGRSLKQKLGDASTDYILSRFNDNTYADFFIKFYKPLEAEINKYAASQALSVPEDIVLFYKGGNLFRVILTDFATYLNNDKFINLLKKRSDADFQIFINPTIKPKSKYDKVCEEVSKRVLAAMYVFKSSLSRSRVLDVNTDELATLYKQVLDDAQSARFRITDVVPQPFRSDFIMNKVATSSKPAIGYKEAYCLLRGFEKSRNDNPSLYISRNLASDFTTFSHKRYFFELIRLKKNIKLKVSIRNETETVTTLQVPSEVIDVSIPKKGDHSLEVMTGHTSTFLQEFRYGRTTFWGTSLEYMLYDLTDILFMKFEWPWLDAKYKKRIDRYFLCLLFACVRDLSLEDMVAELAATYKFVSTNTNASKAVLPRYTFLQLFLYHHESLTTDQKRRLQYPLDAEQYNEYLTYVKDNLDAMVDAAKKIQQKVHEGDDGVLKIVHRMFGLREVTLLGGVKI